MIRASKLTFSPLKTTKTDTNGCWLGEPFDRDGRCL
jgi:hypothetical protein